LRLSGEDALKNLEYTSTWIDKIYVALEVKHAHQVHTNVLCKYIAGLSSTKQGASSPQEEPQMRASAHRGSHIVFVSIKFPGSCAAKWMMHVTCDSVKGFRTRAECGGSLSPRTRRPSETSTRMWWRSTGRRSWRNRPVGPRREEAGVIVAVGFQVDHDPIPWAESKIRDCVEWRWLGVLVWPWRTGPAAAAAAAPPPPSPSPVWTRRPPHPRGGHCPRGRGR
jgi:hypothetical protein